MPVVPKSPVIPSGLLMPTDDLSPLVVNVDGTIKVSNLVKGYCGCAERYYELKTKYDALQKIVGSK